MGEVQREAIPPINSQNRPSQYCKMGGEKKDSRSNQEFFKVT